MQFDVANSDI